jgi:hypothetical protein
MEALVKQAETALHAYVLNLIRVLIVKYVSEYISMHSRLIFFNLQIQFFLALNPTDTNPCIQLPCLNGGLCIVTGLTGFTCSCQVGYSGTNCQNCKWNFAETFCLFSSVV